MRIMLWPGSPHGTRARIYLSLSGRNEASVAVSVWQGLDERQGDGKENGSQETLKSTEQGRVT